MDRQSDAPRQYAFGPFRLSADASLLMRDGKVLRLAPKVLQTLLVLVRHAGSVVSKRVLMEAVWPGVFVEETGLTRNVSVLRKALGAQGEQLVETVPSVGYRFTATVDVVEADGPQHDVADEIADVAGTPFVGRLAELGRLNAALRRADAGRGSALGLAGEPGIGKSTLAERFLSTARTRREVGVGRCSELYGTAEPHLPVLEALDAVTASSSASALLARLAPTWVRHVTGRSPQDAGGPQAASTEHLLRELTRFLTAFSRERTVIWLLEDVHWADTATIDVVAHLAPRLGQLRMLMVLTYRERELELRQHPFAGVRATLWGKGILDEIALPLLSRAEVAEYVAMAAGTDATGVNDDIYARSEGNPLFVSALVGQMVEASAAGPSGHGIPDSVRGLIARPLGQLADEQRDVLDAAALAGHSFDVRVLSRVLEVDPLTLEDRLEEVARAQGLVLRETRGHAHERDAPAWRFRHALYHAMLLEQLPPSRRARLARATVEALTAQHGASDRSVAGTLALLLEAARAYPEAAARLAEASRHAAQQLAYKDAYLLAERGMRCLERATELSSDARLPLELELTLAELGPLSLLQGHGHPTVEALVQRASDLAATLGDRAAMAHAYIQMVFVRLVRGEGLAARDAARRLIGVAESLGSVPLLVNAHVQAQIACHHLGHFAEADQHASTVLRAWRETAARRAVLHRIRSGDRIAGRIIP